MCSRGRLPTLERRVAATRKRQATEGEEDMLRKISMLVVSAALAALAIGALTASGASKANGGLRWTTGGTPVGPPVTAPPEANDFHAFWKPHGGAALRWTIDGVPVGPKIKSPPEANDVDFEYTSTGVFTFAYWTKNGVRIQQIPIPPGANDVHVRLREPRTFT